MVSLIIRLFLSASLLNGVPNVERCGQALWIVPMVFRYRNVMRAKLLNLVGVVRRIQKNSTRLRQRMNHNAPS